MDYRKTAQEIYDHVGKKENIISAAHCATRLRLVIADNDKADPIVHSTRSCFSGAKKLLRFSVYEAIVT